MRHGLDEATADEVADDISEELWDEDGLLRDHPEYDTGPLSDWHWLSGVDQDKLAVLDEHIVYLGGDGGGDAYVQVRTGKYAGTLTVLSHEEVSDDLLDDVRTDGTPDEIIASCAFLELDDEDELVNLEQSYVQLFENIAKIKARLTAD